MKERKDRRLYKEKSGPVTLDNAAYTCQASCRSSSALRRRIRKKTREKTEDSLDSSWEEMMSSHGL